MPEIRAAGGPVVAKHYGPGDHPSGSGQEAHGGDGRWVVTLTHRFYDDHVERDLPGGTVLKRTKTTVKVALTSEERDEMLSDARHYAAQMGGEFDSDLRGLYSSARAAVKRLETAEWTTELDLPAPKSPSLPPSLPSPPVRVVDESRVRYLGREWEVVQEKNGWLKLRDSRGGVAWEMKDDPKIVPVYKHHGPGPHASGSSQDEHGKWADHAAQAYAPSDETTGQERLFDPGARRHPLSDELEEWMGDDYDYLVKELIESDWSQWTGSRQIRHAAVEIVGEHDLAVDPAIHADPDTPGPFAPNATRPAEAPYLEALYLLREVRDGSSYDQLVRGVKLPYGSQYDQFWETVQEGADLELPLLSFSDTWMIGEHSVVDRYGTDVVMILENATGWYGMEIEAPRYTPDDEEMWLADLEAGGWMEEHRDQLEQELASVARSDALRRQIADIDSGRFTIRDLAAEVYGTPVRTEDGRMLVQGGWGEQPGRWAGTEISEQYDQDYYYERWESGDVPHEVVSGGRLRVTRIVRKEDGPDEVYLTQAAVYDPDAGEWVERNAG